MAKSIISLALQGMIKYLQRTPCGKIIGTCDLASEYSTSWAFQNQAPWRHNKTFPEPLGAITLKLSPLWKYIGRKSCFAEVACDNFLTHREMAYDGTTWHNMIHNRSLWFTKGTSGPKKHQPNSVRKIPRKLMSTASLLASLCPSMSWGLQSCCLSQTTPLNCRFLFAWKNWNVPWGSEELNRWLAIEVFACLYMLLQSVHRRGPLLVPDLQQASARWRSMKWPSVRLERPGPTLAGAWYQMQGELWSERAPKHTKAT